MTLNALILAADSALRTLCAEPRASRPTPVAESPDLEMSEAERKEAAALMRVNHVGEVCAQALYTGQAVACKDPALRAQLAEASREETDHLAWTYQRLNELKDRPSLLNPLWYAGSFVIGYAAGKLGGDKVSLGFVVETERQVEAHLQSHMDRLPAADTASRAIVARCNIISDTRRWTPTFDNSSMNLALPNSSSSNGAGGPPSSSRRWRWWNRRQSNAFNASHSRLRHRKTPNLFKTRDRDTGSLFASV